MFQSVAAATFMQGRELAMKDQEILLKSQRCYLDCVLIRIAEKRMDINGNVVRSRSFSRY
jgi:hypothetical protein